MHKITIVGAGRVGEATASLLAAKELAHEVVLIGVQGDVTEGVALDIQESAALFGFDTTVTGGNDPKAMKGSDIVVITAGQPRKPGMSRSDVLDANLEIIRSISDNILRYAPEAMIIVVTNPVDVLTYVVWQVTGWGRHRVFGLSGALDAARMEAFVAMQTGYSARDITAMVLGGHGDSMVPLSRFTCINGIPIEHFLDKESIENIVKRTRQGGAEILALKKASSAYDSPAAAVVEMIDAVAYNRRRIIPCVAILTGEYGQRDIAMGVPAVLGLTGLERIIELPLTDEEKAAFDASSAAVKSDLNKIQ